MRKRLVKYSIKGFDEAFNEIEGIIFIDESLLINSPTFAETSDRPLVGLGITSSYDPKFKNDLYDI